MQIRRAVPADSPAIAPLLGQLGYPTTPDALAARFARVADNGHDIAWVAVDEDLGTTAGFAAGHLRWPFQLDSPVAELSALVVDETHRGTGAGRALVEVFEGWAVAQGCLRMTVSSGFQRAGAHAFYERLGYAQRSKKFEKSAPVR